MYCPGCGKEIPQGLGDANNCPFCGAMLAAARAPEHRPAGIPWEDRGRLGFFASLGATLKQCLSDPTRFFSDLPKREHLGSSLQYLLLLTWVGGLGGLFWNLVFRKSQMEMLKALGLNVPEQAFGAGARLFFALVFALIIPILVLISTFIWTGVVHVLLWILGGAKEGYEATLRAYCYARGSTAIFEWVPFCGGLVALVWGLVLQIIGLSRMHDISGAKAALAVLIPLALCCLVVVALVAAFFTAIMALLGQSGSLS